MQNCEDRRNLLRTRAILGVAPATTGVASVSVAFQTPGPGASEKEPEVTATEDLMREHGVIRRALLVYSDKQLDEISDQFEDIERKMFGHDGFDDVVARIGGVEAMLGLSDLAQFTPPAPPKP